MPQFVVRIEQTTEIDLLIDAPDRRAAAEAAVSEGDEIASLTTFERVIEVKDFARDEYTTVVV